MAADSEFAIQLLFDQRRNGRVHVHSPDVPGLHLAGPNLETIRKDIEPILTDLLYLNSKVVVDQIRWVPSLEEVSKAMSDEESVPSGAGPTEHRYLVIRGHAA